MINDNVFQKQYNIEAHRMTRIPVTLKVVCEPIIVPHIG